MRGIRRLGLVLHVEALKRLNGFPLRLKWAGKALNGYKLRTLVAELLMERELWLESTFINKIQTISYHCSARNNLYTSHLLTAHASIY